MTDALMNNGRKNPFTPNNILCGILLVGVLLVGGYFRFNGMNWDDYSYWHPDERFITLQVLPAVGTSLAFTGADAQAERTLCAERYPVTNGVGGYFDTQCSLWNPNNVGIPRYVYGTLPLFMANFVDDTWRWLALGNDGRRDVEMVAAGLPADDPLPGLRYDGGHISWRFMSALLDTGTIVITFFIGTRLHGKWVGLLAALLYAAAPLPIQKAHYGTVNATTGFFAALAVWFAITVQKKGGTLNYLLFGISFAAALAGRINIVPLFGLIVAAAALRIMPIFDARIDNEERSEILWQNLLGLLLAALVALVGFRIFNPYAFMGPSFFGFSINPRWLADVQASSYDVSGNQDSPPNWQWVGRTAYLFPLGHMVLWGMGIAFGLAAWGSWLWVGWQVMRSRMRATTNLLLFGWVLVYFGWLGGIWVVPMRYFLPLYPALAVLAAWGLLELVRQTFEPPRRQEYTQKALTSRFVSMRRGLAWALPIGAAGFTLLWGAMFTNIYRQQLTRVQGAYWMWEQIPGDFAMQLDDAPAGTPLMNIALPNCNSYPRCIYDRDAQNPAQLASYLEDSQTTYYDFTAPASGTVSTIYAPHLGDPQDDATTESLRITISDIETGEVYGEATVTDDFTRDSHLLGSAYHVPLNEPMTVEQGKTYRFSVQVLSGGPVIIGGSVVASEGEWDDRLSTTNICRRPITVTVASAPPPGTISAQDCNGRQSYVDLIINYDLYMSFPEDTVLKRDTILNGLNYSDYITISSNRFYDTETRNPQRFPMTTRYYEALFSGELGFELVTVFDETFEFGAFRVSDQHLPMYDSPRWLNEFEADEAFHVYDHPAVFIFRKTQDYSSETATAIMNSVPLTTVNEASFIYSCPSRSSETYCSTMVVGVASLPSIQFDRAPSFLQMPDDVRAANTTGGTWSARFDWNSFINTQPVLLVLLWWLVIVGLGWCAFPLLFAIFPLLADRGYGFAKYTGLLLTGWIAWYAASARLPVWWQGGVTVSALIVAALGVLLVWRQRAAFIEHVRVHWRQMAAFEAITLVAFLFFLAVRLSNPDLWHPFFGGEKPMDFAYFNGVLRTTLFPPIDPWYAGGYINYYYYGYVTVGVPVLLLGVVPSIAYNLIVPTLFALTGIGAFSVAFNAMSTWRDRRVVTHAPEVEGEEPRRETRLIHPGSAWVAGTMALLLTVVLGNLDTPRVFIAEGLTQTGFYNNPGALAAQYIADYAAANGGAQPDAETLAQINERATADASSVSGSIWRGLGYVLRGQPIALPTNRWFWAPTRVIDDATPTLDNEIAEIPYFTFLYGDLHAHMIAMPLLFIGMTFVLHELLMVGQRFGVSRVVALMFGGIVVGLMRATNTWDWLTFMVLTVLGLGFAWWLHWRERAPFRSIIYLASAGGFLLFIVFAAVLASFLQIQFLESSAVRLVVLALVAAAGACVLWWLGVTRRSMLYLLLYVGGFGLFQFLAALPFATWFGTNYSSATLYQGSKTPLWAYLTVHGLFLFLIFCLLVWETARWLRSVRVSALQGQGLIILIVLGAAGAALLATVFLALFGYPVALVALPLLLWVGVLFLRPDQSCVMQYLLALAGLALGLTLAVEFVVLVGDIGRQNTIFKFYIQAWLLFSVVGGVAFAVLLQSSDDWSTALRTPWFTVTLILVTTAALYPLMATRAKALERMAPDLPLTLDGMEYMRYSVRSELVAPYEVQTFSVAEDYDMIRWLQQNVVGSPVIMEAVSASEYQWGNRFAIYTGLPSVVGWRWHQVQQRTFEPMTRLVDQRHANVNAFYLTSSIVEAWNILQYYNVEYVIVSGLERARYQVRDQFGGLLYDGLAKFERMVEMGLLEVVYTEGDGFIYRVNQNAVLDVQIASSP